MLGADQRHISAPLVDFVARGRLHTDPHLPTDRLLVDRAGPNASACPAGLRDGVGLRINAA
jgi:hypothetical protein